MSCEVQHCGSYCAIKFLLPKHLAAILIGEKGTNIKNLCIITNANIRLSPPDVLYIATMDRIIFLSGREENCLKAIKYIITLVALSTKIDGAGAMRSNLRWDPLKIDISRLIDPSIYIALRTSIPSDAGGVLLGREGRNIRFIQDASGARIHVSSRGEIAAANERVLTIAGSCESCEKCMQMVLNKVSEVVPSQLDFFSRDMQLPAPYALKRSTRCVDPCETDDSHSYSNITSSSTSSKIITPTSQSPDDDNTRDRRNSKTPSDGSGDTTSESSSSNHSNLNHTDHVDRDVAKSGQGHAKGLRLNKRPGTGNSRYSNSGNTLHGKNIPYDAGFHSSSNRSSSFQTNRGYGNSHNTPYHPHPCPPHPCPPHPTAQQKIPAASSVEPYTVPYPQMRLVRTDSNGVAALDSIAEIADHIYALTTIEMQIPDSHIGMVFGMGGLYFQDIKHASQAEIFVSNRGDYAPGTMNRRVSISGSPANARAAMLLIQKRLEAMPSVSCYESAKRNVEESEKKVKNYSQLESKTKSNSVNDGAKPQNANPTKSKSEDGAAKITIPSNDVCTTDEVKDSFD